MTFGQFKKSGGFLLVVILLLAALVPFAIEQVGESTGWFKFSATKWVSGLFGSSASGGSRENDYSKVKWSERLKDLNEFSEWADGQADVKITIIHPEVFQISRENENPATKQSFSWKLQLLSADQDLSETQVRNRLTLIRDPEDKVTGEIRSVSPLEGGKGFRVTVHNVSGKGKIGLAFEDMPPVYYDVNLQRMWLVPVSSCRAAYKGRYKAAVFFPGMRNGLSEGDVISPGSGKCGYRIVSISDHCVWFEAFYGDAPSDEPLPASIWPDFSRIDTAPPVPPPGRLIFGKRQVFWPGDAIRLPSSGYCIHLDDFWAGRAVVFRILDQDNKPTRELLCVIVREKK